MIVYYILFFFIGVNINKIRKSRIESNFEYENMEKLCLKIYIFFYFRYIEFLKLKLF